MAGHFQNLHFGSEKIVRGRCFDEEIGLGWFEFQLKAEVSKKLGIGNHGRGFGMATDGAVEPLFDLGNILHVIDMPVREQKHVRLKPARFEPLAGAVWCIEQDASLGGVEEVTICLKNPAAKCFVLHAHLIHRHLPLGAI